MVHNHRYTIGLRHSLEKLRGGRVPEERGKRVGRTRLDGPASTRVGRVGGGQQGERAVAAGEIYFSGEVNQIISGKRRKKRKTMKIPA